MNYNIIISILICIIASGCTFPTHNSGYQHKNIIIYTIHVENSIELSFRLKNFNIIHTEHIDIDRSSKNNIRSNIDSRVKKLSANTVFVVSANNLKKHEKILLFANENSSEIQTLDNFIERTELLRVLTRSIDHRMASVVGALVGGTTERVIYISNKDKMNIQNNIHKIDYPLTRKIHRQMDILITRLNEDQNFTLTNIDIPFSENLSFTEIVYIKLYSINYTISKLSTLNNKRYNIIHSKNNLEKIRKVITKYIDKIQTPFPNPPSKCLTISIETIY